VSAAPPPVLVVTGVSGAGKSTVAKALAARLGWRFQEGDDFHPAANVAKMKAGVPLDDADRAPWLAAIGGWIDARAAAGEPAVLSCSALKRAYRATLTDGRPQVRIIFLQGDEALIARRVAARTHSYFPPALLDSQFRDLQPPGPDEHAVIVGIDPPVTAQVEEIVRKLDLA